MVFGSRCFEEARGDVHYGASVIVDTFSFQVLLLAFVLGVIGLVILL